MPVIESSYKNPPFFQFNGHLQSIIPSIFRKVEGIFYERERFTLSDGDFVDIDWLKNNNDKLVILTHGLEGDSHRHYIKGPAKLFSQHGYDVLAWNCRSCSGEINRALRLYNHGEIGDFGEVIAHALKQKKYQKVALVGFSMGGNITLKYLGANGSKIPVEIKVGVSFSAPTDMLSSVELLDLPSNLFYRKRFMEKLFKKMEIKAKMHPNQIDLSLYKKVKVWKDFDTFFSAPINGFKSADELYEQASAINFMEDTIVPVLICNAQNDPLLSPECTPSKLAQRHPLIFVESSKQGGHVGFMNPNQEFTWAEHRALDFVNNTLF